MVWSAEIWIGGISSTRINKKGKPGDPGFSFLSAFHQKETVSFNNLPRKEPKAVQ